MNISFSFIIPVYNRPEEIRELLDSLALQTYGAAFEIVVVEDGSTIPCEAVIEDFKRMYLQGSSPISLTYLKKSNSGPGRSRNYGMVRAKGDYFIILDSDCILPPHYLDAVTKSLQEHFVHCYGGPDAAHASFSLVQKGIDYAMTSVLTTGGIRGKRKAFQKNHKGRPSGQGRKASASAQVETGRSSSSGDNGNQSNNFGTRQDSPAKQKGFQPRSFNMGLSRIAFEATGGFGNIHPGEDPDLVFRLWGKGFATKLIPTAFVYHKRRIDWQKFFLQVKKFGSVRPILNRRYPRTAKMTYWFPTLFCLGFMAASMLWYLGIRLPMLLYVLYLGFVFLDSLLKNRSLAVALLSLVAVCIQFMGYGYGFIKSTIFLNFSGKPAERLFPELFFGSTDTEDRT
ncbi:glycosyltransferase [Pricia sp. S334]|uniref:Glycosyltransferase n=1 Tax=Pricia mediterranea TaxID=3076079 RepID=A0ABU3LBX2_9FLAO|nr:glycosyltransferase [Pricia sp. S334]MDT7830694.1 glycosyltransferase [Pricia sp. S334]